MAAGDTLLNGRYRLISQHGSGGMAVIYKSIDEKLGRTVAVKILRPSLTADPMFITRFQNEARSIANLTHPNIVTVHDVGNDGLTNYIVMEFIEGQDLKKIIKASGTLPIDRAVNLAIGICAGLGFAHRAGIVHADVKPQNILLTKDDVVKITDFGIAQALSDTQPPERASVVWGSPHYFAPEQAQGERPTAAADVYSIGIVLFEMLTGQLPYMGTNQQELALAHIREPIPVAKDRNPAIPEDLSRIVYKVMSKNPTDRYRMADQLGRVLIEYRDRARNQTVRAASQPPPLSIPGEQPQRTPPPPPAQPQFQHRFPQGNTLQEALPTQRYGVAPNAPNPVNYGNSPATTPAPRQPDADQYGQPMNAPRSTPPPGLRTDSGPYVARFQDDPEVPNVLDGVTIALAALAFMAVACLIPLYIIVLQARLG